MSVIAFVLTVLVVGRKRFEVNNVHVAFLAWAAIVLFEYYFLGQNSYVHMDDEGDHFIPYLSYLVNYHLGGQFGHNLDMGFDVYAAQSPGAEFISPDRFLISVFPTWIAILIHKFIIVAAGFSGTYLLCRRGLGSDKTTAAVIAAFFVVSNRHLMVITYGVGAGVAFLPMAIYAFVARADERTYYPQAFGVATLAALYLKPSHAFTAMVVGVALAAVVLGRVRWRVVVSLGVLLAAELLNWGEVLYAMYQIAPLTERGSNISAHGFGIERIGNVLRHVIVRTEGVSVFWIALAALLYLWARRSPMRWRGLIAVFGPQIILVILLLFPWETIGLTAVKNLSHHYVLLASTALVLPLLAEAVRVTAPSLAGGWGDQRHLARTLVLAAAVGMMAYFKAYNFANLLYHGGQSQYHTIGTLADRTWGKGEPSRVLTLRVRDLGPEPGVVYGFYGLESIDIFLAIPTKPLSAFYRYGFPREASREDPRQFIDWSKWVNGRYRVGEQLPLPLLRAANVGFILSPLPMEADGIRLVTGPVAPPMTKSDMTARPVAYFHERIHRLFDFNDLYVYALNDPLSQVYAARRVVTVPDAADDASVLAALARHVDERPVVTKASRLASVGVARSSLRVESFRKVRDGFDARVSAPEGGIVVVNTPAMPFWRAEADGHALSVVSVNTIHMAVSVPAGAREIKFRYHRPTLGDALRRLVN